MLGLWMQLWPNLLSTVILGALSYGFHSHFFVKFRNVVIEANIESEGNSETPPRDPQTENQA